MAETLYEHAGGADAMLALAGAFHARCLEDPELEHPFSHPGQHPEHVARLAAYWGQVWGGPSAYTGAAGGDQSALQRMHAHEGTMVDLGHRFVAAFDAALDDVPMPDDGSFRSAARAYLDWATADVLAYSARGAVVPEGLKVPQWTWDSAATVAASNNADRIDEVCAADGTSTHRDTARWWSDTRTPPLHPDVVTLRAGLTAAEVLAGVDDGVGCSVKDSFADVDLTSYGFTVIIDGSWLWRAAERSTEGPLGWQWSVHGDALTARTDGQLVASCTITPSGPVVGVTNLDADGVDPVATWTEVVSAIAATHPNLPVVAWDPLEAAGAAVAAGFRVVGPMRVWARR